MKTKLLVIAALVVMGVFILNWYLELQKLTGTEFGIANDWWVQLVKPEDGEKLNGSEISAVITAFLYMPLQTILSFVVLIAAIINICLIRKQIRQTKSDAATANLSQLIGGIDSHFEELMNNIHKEIINDNKNCDGFKVNKNIHRFYSDMNNSLPIEMSEKFRELYGEFDPFGKLNIEATQRLTVDYWGCVNSNLLGSSDCAKSASYMSLVLKSGIESGLDKIKVHKLLFSFLSTKLIAKELDPRETLLNIYYADITHNGVPALELIEFFQYANSIFKNSLIATFYGDDSESILNKMISSKTFLISLNDRSIKDIYITNNSRVEVILRDGKSIQFSIYKKSSEFKILDKDKVLEAIRSHRYVGDLIFVDGF